MSNKKTLSQGEDMDFSGRLLDFSGDPIDLTSITYKLYVVIHDSYRNVVKKFANDNGADVPGWEPITITTPATGEFELFLYSSETKPLTEGVYYMEVRLKDAMALYGPDDGSLDVVKPRIYLFDLLESVINNLLP